MAACRTCAETMAVTIRMRISGRDLVFHGCGNCESNTWETQGSVLSLDEVLQLARSAS